MLDILLDAIKDTVNLIPFLFLTYLIMEYIENKMSGKAKEKIEKAGKWGPLLGGIVGIFPQCGFSASATNLYSSGLISIGTLIAVYLATSDEMIPIFISRAMSLKLLVIILAIKLILGVCFGFLIDFIYKKINKDKKRNSVDLCEEEHCDCKHKGILKASIKHTINIIFYIFIITIIINILIEIIGQENIEQFLQAKSFLGPIIASLIGLIPNCAASVILTNLYIENVINIASLIAGLLTGAGVGLIVLFKTNKKNLKENVGITLLIYVIGVVSGLVIQLIT